MNFVLFLSKSPLLQLYFKKYWVESLLEWKSMFQFIWMTSSFTHDHLKIIEEIFNRFEESNFVVNVSKWSFERRKIEYLGYQIEHGKISALSDKVESVRRWPAPNSKKGVRCFLGGFNQYRRFIPNVANLVEPLQLLLRKRIEFDWGGVSLSLVSTKEESLYSLWCQWPPIDHWFKLR